MPPTIATAAQVPFLRLAAQRLAGARFDTPVEAARWMTASQGQDLRGVLTSLALRTTGATSADVKDAFDRGELVRSWPMRGTLHAVAGEDLRWMLAVAAGRVRSGMAKRLTDLSLDEATIAWAHECAVAALSGGGRLTREELCAIWLAAGIETTGQRGIHLILTLSLAAVLCYGPFAGDKQQLVLLDEWVPRPRVLETEAAVGEWALRFFRSHGPATLADFARWTKLPLGLSRAGLALARPQLERLDLAGGEHWMDPGTPDVLAACHQRASGVFLLPGFDEYVLGYADRSVILAAAHADAVVPGNNGMFQHTVVAGGQVIGTWRRAPRGSKRPIVATPLAGEFSPAVTTEIERLAALLT